MRLQAFMDVLEQLAPAALAEEWDNAGLVIEPEEKDITRVLVALDCTVAVAREARALGAQLVLAHHPLFFKPARRMYYTDPDTAAACTLIRGGVGFFCAHTNLDAARNGVNDVLARAVGLREVYALSRQGTALEPQNPGVGRIGSLQKPLTLSQFAKDVADTLHTVVRISGGGDKHISRVAVIGGAGGGYMDAAVKAGADVLLTGEVKHDVALAARVAGMELLEAGHYETESIVLGPWVEGLQKALKDIQCRIDFIRATTDKPCLVAP
ncbi:MAG: Nif3-like dinuclear metal center hexameric protein [Clostridiales bacterium]|jgi:dinuclear metal center YbgI/SA1388 family protein|nr:Nif3-like dinuclear metal center hexameric protein [Clostridiales bacterium]